MAQLLASSLDPLRRLPYELISTTLQLARHEWPRTYLESPLLFGGVCRFWREIAWGTPGLWNSLSFVINQSSSQPSHNLAVRTVLLREWVERSDPLPLTLCLEINGENELTVTDESLQPLIDVIHQFSSRWHTLLLGLPQSILNMLILSDMPQLRLLSLYPPPPLYNTAIQLPHSLYQALPNVVELDLTRSSIDPRHDELIWTNMQDARLMSCSFVEMAFFLQKAPFLKCADFWMKPDTSDSVASNFSLTHSTLEDLKLFCVDHDGVDFLLDSLSFPNIKHLSFSGSRVLLSPITAMLKRSSANVETFHFGDSGWRPDQLAQCLDEMKTLQRLNLHQTSACDADFVDRVFEAVFRRLPNLEHFRLFYPWDQQSLDWRFLDHIPVPLTGLPYALKEVMIDLAAPYSETIPFETMSRVEMACRAGLVLRVSVYDLQDQQCHVFTLPSQAV